jgi:acyl transferase domain-containing protein
MKVSYRAFATSPDEEIVISGIAGRFPKSANVAEFSDNLYNKVFKTDLSQNFI